MKDEYKSLFTPWKIKNCEIKNRIVLTSMGGTSIFGWMEPHHFDKEAANFLLERAKNNVGLILPGIAPIRNVMGGQWLYKSKKSFVKLKEFMTEFHKTGAKLFIQLTAGFGRSFAVTEMLEKLYTNKFLGTIAKPMLDVERLTASCSELPNRWTDNVPSRALTVQEILDMIDGFAKTAKMCQDAGVDGVEIHAVHEGYLLDQFTLKYCNKRTDEYGGSFENRYRFPCDIVKAIKALCGDDFPVSLRYSVVSKTKGFRQGALPGEKYVEVGRDLEESIKAAQYLQDAGYDMLNADNGTYDAWYWSHPPMYMPQNCNLEDCAAIKPHINIPIVCAGRMDPVTAAKAISENKIDGMGVARQFLTDPEWVTKLMNDKEEEIMPCICCHNGCFNMAHYKGVGNDQDLDDTMHMARCALNPMTMHTNKYFIKTTTNPKRIAVIGAGIGGMEVARVATLRGHKVTIYEKGNNLGGVFVAASAPFFKEKDKELLKWYELQMKKLNIEIKFNTEVKDISTLEADKVVVATGATAITLPIPGWEQAIEACDYLLGNKKVGKNVIIVGGGLTGCEIAYDLYNKGCNPTIVEMKDDIIAVKGVSLANSSYLRDFFALNKVPILLNTKVDSITSNGIVAIDKEGKKITVEGDSVIVSVGYKPAPLETKGVQLVGDCLKVGNLKTVIWRAWDVAMKL